MPLGLRRGEAGPGARESAGGAESGRATPRPGRRRRAAGGRRGGCGRRMPGGVGARRERPRPLCGARYPGRLDGSRVKGKESTSSEGCGGGLGDRAEPHREAWNLWRVRGGVSSAAEYRQREGAGPARGGPGSAPGRASSAGLAGRTRSGCARDTNAVSAGRQTEAISCRVGLHFVCQHLWPALGATEPLSGEDEERA